MLLQKTGCRNAFYSGASWDPKVVQYDENLKSYRQPGHAFDRIFFRGACWVECCLVGRGRHFSEGCGFYVSDHFAVMGVLDVSDVYERMSGGRRKRALRETVVKSAEAKDGCAGEFWRLQE